MSPDPAVLGALVLWGAVVGMDLVSFPQAMLSRPVVAGAVAGLLIGDLHAGFRVGVVLELFALEVLPIGASRYPDFGPPTVVAVAAAAGAPWRDALGPAVLLALMLAALGGRAIEWLRRWNGTRLRRAEAALAAGDAAILARLQRLGLAGDALRGALVTALGVALLALGRWLLTAPPAAGPSLTLVVVGGALVAATGGVVRRAGAGGVPRRVAGLGLAVGALVAWLWV